MWKIQILTIYILSSQRLDNWNNAFSKKNYLKSHELRPLNCGSYVWHESERMGGCTHNSKSIWHPLWEQRHKSQKSYKIGSYQQRDFYLFYTLWTSPVTLGNIIEWWNQTVCVERIIASVTQQHVFLPVTTATCMTVVHINLKQEEYHRVVESDSRCGTHHHIRHKTTCIPPRHHGYMCDSSTYQPETRRISLSGGIRQ